jgi:arylsulfatase A-like enzyme
MMRSDRYKLLRLQDGRELLYDLREDPAETTNLAASRNAAVQQERRTRAEAMDRLVERLRREAVPKDAPPQTVKIDEETRRQLRALGYVQ